MSNKYKILEILKNNELTIKEIAKKTEFNENESRTYVHRLVKDGLVKKIGKKERYVIYTALKEEQHIFEKLDDLKFLKGLFEKGAIKVYREKS